MYRTLDHSGQQQERGSFGLLGRRIAAYLVDIVLLFATLAPAGQLMVWLLDASPPQTGPAIERVILWNFSLPTWIYFTLSDQSAPSATLGKRLLKIQTCTLSGQRLSIGRALLRTAVKLLPWELAHLSAFALSTDLSRFNLAQIVGVAVANLLTLVYLAIAVATRGRRSVHDYVAGTFVRSASAHAKTLSRGL
jgi:uncharacterized RDD family membrane protein YckC